MSSGAEPAVMTCRCGRLLRLSGAVPGRVGRCPSCGATFRMPESGPPTSPPPAPAPARPRPEPDDDPAPGGYDLSAAPVGADAPAPTTRRGARADSTYAPPSEPERRGSAGKRRRVAIEPVGRGGILPLPKAAESSPWGALLYPIWDGLGLMALVLLPLPLTVSSLMVFALIPMVLAGGAVALFGPIAFAFILVLALAVGYTLSWLSAVLVASAQGDVHHPGWPDVEIGAIFLSLFRWAVTFGLAGVPAWLAASAFLAGHAEPGLPQRLGLVLILSAGGLYGLMALLSVCLHDDILAIHPGMVMPAALRIGAGYLAACAAFSATLVLGELIVTGIYRLSDFGPILLATWAAWIFAVYAGMVVMRMLGRAYHRRAKRVGWFAARRRRDDTPPAPTPVAPPGAEI